MAFFFFWGGGGKGTVPCRPVSRRWPCCCAPLIPDAVRAWQAGNTLTAAERGEAIVLRPSAAAAGHFAPRRYSASVAQRTLEAAVACGGTRLPHQNPSAVQPSLPYFPHCRGPTLRLPTSSHPQSAVLEGHHLVHRHWLHCALAGLRRGELSARRAARSPSISSMTNVEFNHKAVGAPVVAAGLDIVRDAP